MADGERKGRTVSYEARRGRLVLSGTSATLNGRRLRAAARDRTPPRTTVTLRRRGRTTVLTPKARDRSGVRATFIQIRRIVAVRVKRVPAYARASAGVALLVLEVIGCLAMWAPIPLAWMWVGARVYEVTGSLSADLAVAFGGFFATTLLTMGALNRIDMAWVELRRRSGHDQREGALTQIVVVSATIAMVVFWVWFHILERAFIIPFMPTR